MFKHLFKFSIGLVLVLGLSNSATAENHAAPLLTITGDAALVSTHDTISLSRADLMALPVTTFNTSTIWTEGVHSFTGVSLADLLASLGVEDGVVVATAINDYAVEIPVSDAIDDGPIIAYLIDGKEMTVRDKGPLWVIYPYDSNAKYRSELIYSRSIWQLDRLEIVR